MRNCLICTTPYQILAVMSLIKDIDGKNDLYIINQFDGAELVADRIRNESIFDEVIYVDEEKLFQKYNRNGNKLHIRISLANMYMKVDQIVKQFIKHEDEYTHLYVSSKCFVGRLIQFYEYKHYKTRIFSYYDDGIGSYCNENLTQASFIDRVCRRIFIGRGINQINNIDWYLYNTDLFQKMHKDDNQIVHKITFLNQNTSNISLICRIFALKKLSEIKEKVIIFDSLKEKELTKKGVDELCELFGIVSQTVKKEHLIFKAHPRDKKDHNEYMYLQTEGNIQLPFEVYGLVQDFTDKILITNMSTAVFSPKLVLDQEPIVIFLFKILEEELLQTTEIQELVFQFKKLYRDSSKIMVPTSKEELKEILQDILCDSEIQNDFLNRQ